MCKFFVFVCLCLVAKLLASIYMKSERGPCSNYHGNKTFHLHTLEDARDDGVTKGRKCCTLTCGLSQVGCSMFMNTAARRVGKTVQILLETFLFRFMAEEDVQDACLSGFTFTDSYCMICNN